MKTKFVRCLILLAVIFIGIRLQAQGSAFTYQGRLNGLSGPATGTYDFAFTVYDSSFAGNAVAGPVTNSAVSVSNGLFTTTIDAGSAVFNGSSRWLEIAVRTNGSSTFFTLSPRQAFTPSPYSITAGSISGPLPASQISGTIPSSAVAGTYGNAVTFNNANNQFTGSYSGNGGALTNVNAATLNGLDSSGFWKTNGNNVAPGQFIGSLNNQAIEIRANNKTVVIVSAGANDAPNIKGGAPINAIDAGVQGSVIAGGGTTNFLTFMSSNRISTDFAAISGGSGNWIQSGADHSIIGAGLGNVIRSNSYQSVIAGGQQNTISNTYGTVGGGGGNRVLGNYGTIAGGSQNTATNYGTVGGGLLNTASDRATVGGGNQNNASGFGSTVAGGEFNTASGTHSFAAGRKAVAAHNGSFVWADETDAQFQTTGTNQFLVRASGGVGINTPNPNGDSLAVSGNRAGGWPNPVGYFENLSTDTNASPALRVVAGGNTTDGALTVSSQGTGLIARFGNAVAFVADVTTDGTVDAVNFSGGGSGLTALNASQLTLGSVPSSAVSGTYSSSVNFNNSANSFTGNALSISGNQTGGWPSPVASIVNTSTAANASPALRVLASGNLTDGALNVSANGSGLIARFGNAGSFVADITTNGTVDAVNFVGAGSGLTGLNASQLTSGTVPSSAVSGTYSGLVNFTNSGNSFSGNGSGLTGLNASQLTSGTVPNSSVSGSYSGAVTFNNPSNNFAGNGGGLTNVNASAVNGVTAAGLWQLGGNKVNAGQFIGSTNNQALEFRVNNQTAFLISPSAGDSPNVKNGAPINAIDAGVQGAVIAGGGSTNVLGSMSSNRISSDFATIGGGSANWVQADHAVIGGGLNNLVASGSYESVIAGGLANLISTNYATVSGGSQNNVSGQYGTVAGGFQNSATGQFATVGGGQQNNATFYNAAVGGGYLNSATGNGSTIGGGFNNNASAVSATIPGGANNTASGNNSFAAGNKASAATISAFVWSDGVGGTFTSTDNYQFLIHSINGVGINTNNPNGSALNVNGNVNASSFSGDGSALTNLNLSGKSLAIGGSQTGGWPSPVASIVNTSTATNASPALRVVASGTTSDGALNVSATGSGLIARFGNAGNFVADITTSGAVDATAFNGGTIRVGSIGTTISTLQAGQATMPNSATTATNLTVAFPQAFSSVPKVIASVANDPNFPNVNDTFGSSISSITTTNFRINVVRMDTTGGWGQQLRVNWQAWQ